MKFLSNAAMLVPLLFVACAAAQEGQQTDLPQEDTEWTKMFDGRTLAGWEGNKEIFRVEDGAIVGGTMQAPIEHNEFLCFEKSYGDFELRLKCKLIRPETNAGIQFRSERIPDHFEVRGYQADMGQGWWGKLYDESRRARVLAGPEDEAIAKIVKPDDWNDYRIRCQGDRIQLWVNGQQTVDYREPDAEVARSGVIGLQIHGGPPGEAWYKDIFIRPLEAVQQGR